jgi:hypothetical protein
MTYRIMTWAAVAWIAVWLTPYLYAVNDLIMALTSVSRLARVAEELNTSRTA